MDFKNIQRVTEKRFVQELHNHPSKTYRKITAAIPLNWFLFVLCYCCPLVLLVKIFVQRTTGRGSCGPPFSPEGGLFVFPSFPTSPLK